MSDLSKPLPPRPRLSLADQFDDDAAASDWEKNNPDTASFTTYVNSGPGLDSKAGVDPQGRINVEFNLKKSLPDLPPTYARQVKEFGVDPSRPLKVPPLNIVIFIVGSRGDVQPYLALALRLIQRNGHRVRIATHDTFKSFVLEQKQVLKGWKDREGRPLEDKLEFFGIGGDPKELMAYMVKNPGLLPGFESLKNGDIVSKRKMVKRMLHNFYTSTYMADQKTGRPFAADAIISNPPAFAHIHVAEALGLPLTMSFTMPWSPTTEFSHPLVQVKRSNAQKGLTNYLSFAMAEALTWQGLGDVINRFRIFELRLEPISMISGASVLDRLKIPHLYCWSSALIPKPADWMEHIDITGFLFLESTDYEPDPALQEFLKSGPPPIYIGFGSIVVDDPTALTNILLEAVEKAGVRALISAGWSQMGGVDVPRDVFILDNVPHDWMFAEGRVSAICIHGGAGTTAIGLRNGLPTIVVPFFGDQPFWGAMIAKTGAGPEPIPFKQLNSDVLAEAIAYALSPKAKQAAMEMGRTIRAEDGADQCVDAFHHHLPLLHMRCDLDPDRVAVWWSEKLALRLSALAAQVLVNAKLINMKSLEPHRAKEYLTRRTIADPMSAGVGAMALLNTVTEFSSGVAQVFYKPGKGLLNITTSLTRGMMNVLVDVHQGLDVLPRLYGTKDRRPVIKVHNVKSGLKAGAAGFWFGWWDGISGLVVEPIRGGKEQGTWGAVAGTGRGILNSMLLPAIGTLGLASLPVHGAYMSAKRKMLKLDDDEYVLYTPRLLVSQEEFHRSSLEERMRIVDAFNVAKTKVNERKASIVQSTQDWLDKVETEWREAGWDGAEATTPDAQSSRSGGRSESPYKADPSASTSRDTSERDWRLQVDMEKAAAAKEQRLQNTLRRLEKMQESRRKEGSKV